MKTDYFAQARERFTVPSLWSELGLEGEPKRSCRSPFREDGSPSFSIHDDGRKWHDHGTGEGGDVIEFIKAALRTDYQGVRDWIKERSTTPISTMTKPTKQTKRTKARRIMWPSKIEQGTTDDWNMLHELRGYSYQGIHLMIQCGALRFATVDDHRAFIVTDERLRIAEIRRMDGKTWSNGSKAYPLKGVDKSLLLGSPIIEQRTQRVMLVEGSTDYLVALDLYCQYRRKHKGRICWVPVAILGAGCRQLADEDRRRLRGKYVRIVPDADAAGDQMTEHWQKLLRSNGSTVDIVDLPPETDLSDHFKTIKPTELYS